MARPLRMEFPDAVYHATSRGLEGRAIVYDDADRARWLDLLDRVATRRHWRVYAFALMDNHSHLYVRTPQGDLSAGLHDLNAGYVGGFNRRHRRVGPLLQGRPKVILVERASHEWELSRYVHLNPVRAGLVADPAAYRWSSCRACLRPSLAPAWLAWEEVLAAHGRTVREAQRRYREYLRDGLARPPRSPLEGVVASTLLGSPAFVERMKERLAGWLPDREVPAVRALRPMASLDEIEAAVCAEYGVRAEALRQRGRHGNEARWVAMWLTRELTTLPLQALGTHFGGVGPAAVSNGVRWVQGQGRLVRRLVAVRQRFGGRSEKRKMWT